MLALRGQLSMVFSYLKDVLFEITIDIQFYLYRNRLSRLNLTERELAQS